MFLRRRKLLVILVMIAVAWFALTTLLGRSTHSKVQMQSNRPKLGNGIRQPEFYYDSADEVIELEAVNAQENVKKISTESFILKTKSQVIYSEHDDDDDKGFPELEELKDEDLDIVKKTTKNPFLKQKEENVFVTSIVKRAGLKWTPVREVLNQDGNHPPGFNGTAVLLEEDSLSPNERRQYDNGWSKFAHNEYVSRLIPLRRVLPDVRDPECKLVKYSEILPNVSIVITFHNEAWTTLLRTLHSIIDRTPSHLIAEIILIDDCSTEEHLKQQLVDYLQLLPKVRLVRILEQLGVIRARQQGATLARGSVLVFLDSHIECSTGWLEPLLEQISTNRTSVAIPVMDIIDDATFQYKSFDAKSANIGGFDWSLQFTWIGISEREKKRQKTHIEAIRSPTMSGGMYAISRKWFNHLGGYDIGMDMWGAENLEMSFRVWMCGGSLVVVPCSHVGHVFRKRSVYQLPTDGENPRKNFMRVAEVWMDDFKTHYYDKIGGRPSSDNIYGDVNDRKQLRTNLKCESFQWYLKNVFPELFIPNDALAFGEIRNQAAMKIDTRNQPACLDSVVGSNAINSPVKVWPCHGQGGNQYWMLSAIGEIRRDDGCFDYAGKSVVIYPCHGQRGNQEWQYTLNGVIRHRGTKRCMELSESGIVMSPCRNTETQIWVWKRNKAAKADNYEMDNDGLVENSVAKQPDLFGKKKSAAQQDIAEDDY